MIAAVTVEWIEYAFSYAFNRIPIRESARGRVRIKMIIVYAAAIIAV
jgi:hypothetical protein